MSAGIWTSMAGGLMGSEAAGGASDEQRKRQLHERAEAIEAARPTAKELKALDDQHAFNIRDIERREKLLASIDPALIEAGNQALGLLQGKEVKGLDPVRKRREQQREQLKQRLRDELGPGFETSTAGAQALAQFDQATEESMFQIRDATLGRLLGTAQNVQGLASIQGNLGQLLGEQQARGQIRSRQVNAMLGTPVTAPSGRFVRDALTAQTISSTGEAM